MKFSFLIPIIFLTGCANPNNYTPSRGYSDHHSDTVYLFTHSRPATSADDVKIYSAMPSSAQTLGVVFGHCFGLKLSIAVERAKIDAAAIGANGIVIPPENFTYDAANNTLVKGIAVFVP